jgi:ApaG protein
MNNNPKIGISVTTKYIPEQSSTEDNHYVFSYTITIKNYGKIPTKLISRHWIITDSNAKKQEVFGDGVIGKQPELNSGDQFCYTSGVVLETPVGSMEGKYFMESKKGNFETPIPAFTLAIPEILN